MGQRYDRLRELLRSRKGKNAITFLVFLVISTVLWVVMAINEDTQSDLRCHLSIVNVPDSVTRISALPPTLSVNVRTRGTTLLRHMFSKNIDLKVDYRQYAQANRIHFNDASLKSFLRNRLGGATQVISVSPDTILVSFTANRGVMVPVKVDAHVMPGPQFAVNGKARPLTDSVMVYAVNAADANIKSISTEPIVLNDVRSSQTLRVALRTSKNVRAVPDSVDVHIDVEPLVAKSRMVKVTPVNVPQGYRLITVPSEVEVYYMVPMSIYKSADSNPNFSIRADYGSVAESGKIAVTLNSAPKDFLNVFVDVDSVDFILEKREP